MGSQRDASNSSLSQTRSASSSLHAQNGDGRADTRRAGRRQRASAACQVCRARKVKCTNERPSCAGCVRLGCECRYPEPARYLQPSPNQGNSNSEVIETLHEILYRLPPATDSRHERRTSDAVASDALSFVAVDHVFEWPTFAADSSLHSTPFNVLSIHQSQELHPGASNTVGIPGLQPEEITALLTRFLRMVHTMNPILDCTTLMNHGRIVAELGPQWDSRTCLVLITAALGALAQPYNAFPNTKETLSSSSSSEGRAQYRQRAEAYYQFARRRFGILGMNLTACQCHYLSGIYLLHTLRPLEAWQSFFQASSLYAVYLKNQAALRAVRDTGVLGDQMMTDEHSLPDDLEHDLQQRLYWSCIKSESELCAEVNLPRSSLHNIDYPYQFPSPPTPRSVDGLDDSPLRVAPSSSNNIPSSTSSSTTPGHYSETQDFKELHEWSWLNYLSEISLLKLSGRVNQAFYSMPPSSWATMNLLDMINTAYEFEKQIEQWKLTLPRAISCFPTPLDISTVTELQLVPWLRSANIRLRIYRPFLYRFTCKIDNDWPLAEPMRHLAEKTVVLCMEPLFDLGLRHRNAESWFRCRETACRALLLICARRSGLLRLMELEHRANETLELCISHLRYWEKEAEDVRQACRALETMM